jgi:cell division protein FtsB
VGEDRLAELVAENRANIATLAGEMERVRQSIHDLRSTVRGVEYLTRTVDELHADLSDLAQQAAEDAVTEYLRRRHADTFANLRTYAALVSAGVALGALIVAAFLR